MTRRKKKTRLKRGSKPVQVGALTIGFEFAMSYDEFATPYKVIALRPAPFVDVMDLAGQRMTFDGEVVQKSRFFKPIKTNNNENN